jgi:hypothetical protein
MTLVMLCISFFSHLYDVMCPSIETLGSKYMYLLSSKVEFQFMLYADLPAPGEGTNTEIGERMITDSKASYTIHNRRLHLKLPLAVCTPFHQRRSWILYIHFVPATGK